MPRPTHSSQFYSLLSLSFSVSPSLSIACKFVASSTTLTSLGFSFLSDFTLDASSFFALPDLSREMRVDSMLPR